MIRSAMFSEDRKRRFALVRDWRDERGVPNKTVLFGMLNPSTANASEDDPTVRKVIGFGRRWGFGRVVVVNLNPIVSTDPWALPPWSGIDRRNRAVMLRWMGKADMVVAAWGSQPRAICRSIALPELVHSFQQTLLAGAGLVDLYCIGTTQRGDPLHPSRARYTDAALVWRKLSMAVGADES